jgi:4a-hydroxytetrahydrobiopterin dehydratase
MKIGGRYPSGMSTIDAREAQERLSALPKWALQNGALVRKFTFAGFPEAIAYVVRLGFTAEAADHHPDIVVNYKRVTLTYVTHSAGGLTNRDFEGAASAGKLAEAMGGA